MTTAHRSGMFLFRSAVNATAALTCNCSIFSTGDSDPIALRSAPHLEIITLTTFFWAVASPSFSGIFDARNAVMTSFTAVRETLLAILSVLSSIAAFSTAWPSSKARSSDCVHSDRKSASENPLPASSRESAVIPRSSPDRAAVLAGLPLGVLSGVEEATEDSSDPSTSESWLPGERNQKPRVVVVARETPAHLPSLLSFRDLVVSRSPPSSSEPSVPSPSPGHR